MTIERSFIVAYKRTVRKNRMVNEKVQNWKLNDRDSVRTTGLSEKQSVIRQEMPEWFMLKKYYFQTEIILTTR